MLFGGDLECGCLEGDSWQEAEVDRKDLVELGA